MFCRCHGPLQVSPLRSRASNRGPTTFCSVFKLRLRDSCFGAVERGWRVCTICPERLATWPLLRLVVAAWLIELAFVHEIKAGLSSGAAFGHPELAHVQPNTERAIR